MIEKPLILAENETYRVSVQPFKNYWDLPHIRNNPKRPVLGHLNYQQHPFSVKLSEQPLDPGKYTEAVQEIMESGGIFCTLNRSREGIPCLAFADPKSVTGYLYATADELRTEYGSDATNPETKQRAIERFKKELYLYELENRMEVYALVAEKLYIWDKRGTTESKTEWGPLENGYQGPFFGDEWQTPDAIRTLPVEVRAQLAIIPASTEHPEIEQKQVEKSIKTIKTWMNNIVVPIYTDDIEASLTRVEYHISSYEASNTSLPQRAEIICIAEEIDRKGTNVSPENLNFVADNPLFDNLFVAINKQLTAAHEHRNHELNIALIEEAKGELSVRETPTNTKIPQTMAQDTQR